jgi:hypothetical protein
MILGTMRQEEGDGGGVLEARKGRRCDNAKGVDIVPEARRRCENATTRRG